MKRKRIPTDRIKLSGPTRVSLHLISLFQIATTAVLGKIWPLLGSLKVVNAPHVNSKTPYLFVANHASYADVYGIFLGLPFKDLRRAAPTRFMTGNSIYFSLLRPIIFIGGGFPTKNKKAPAYNAVAASVEFLRLGQNIVIFPEGGRHKNVDGRVHTGVKRIIDSCQFPLNIVLVHLIWSRRGWRRDLEVRYGEIHEIRSADEIMESVYRL